MYTKSRCWERRVETGVNRGSKGRAVVRRIMVAIMARTIIPAPDWVLRKAIEGDGCDELER